MLKLSGVDICGINGIKSLNVNFNPGINIICGKNGIGKTTILECIVSLLNNRTNNNIRKNLNSHESYYVIYGLNKQDNFYREKYLFDEDDDNNKRWEYKYSIENNRKVSNNYVYLSIHRSQINSIYGNKLELIQNWFGEVYNKRQLSIFEYDDFQMAVECFSKLDPKIQYSGAKFSENHAKNRENSDFYSNRKKNKAEIYVKTSDGEMPLKYLSAGYLSCLAIFLDIIKKAKTISGFENAIEEYEGLILIDEIDLHLHPEWQKKVLEILKWMIPKAQIIATTHSPHIIQAVEANEVIVIDNQFGICHTKVNNSNFIYGYQGWSIEEILEDVMGLKNTYSDLYNDLLKSIENAIDKMDAETANRNLQSFKQLLHPNNHLAKILSIQVASIEGVRGYD